jgi:hypothetical protein
MFQSINDLCVPRINAPGLIATLVGTALIFIPTHPTSADEAADAMPLQVAFHIDLIGDQLQDAAASNTSAAPTPQAMEFNFVGLPVKLGMKDDASAASMGLEARLQGDYEVALSQKWFFAASAALAKTGYADNSWGTERAVASTTLRYQHDGLMLALEPSWSLRMTETTATQRDYAATARFAKNLFKGVDLSGGVSYIRHDAWSPADDYASASAYATLSYRVADRISFDFSYAASYKLPDDIRAGSLSLDDLRYAANNAGPTVTMSLPLWDDLDIAATYRYCLSTDELPRAGEERRVDDIQSFDVSAAWHSDDPDFGGIDFTAAYGYDRLSTNARNADEQSHTATIAMAIPF